MASISGPIARREIRRRSDYEGDKASQADPRNRVTSRVKQSNRSSVVGKEQPIIGEDQESQLTKLETTNHVPALGSPFVHIKDFSISSPVANSSHSPRTARTAESPFTSETGYYSMSDSFSSESACTCTDDMSDLIINTGLEDDRAERGSPMEVSSLPRRVKSISTVLQYGARQNSIAGVGNENKRIIAPLPDNTRKNDLTPLSSTAQGIRATLNLTHHNYESQEIHYQGPLLKPKGISLSPDAPPFLPRQTPTRSYDIYDIAVTNQTDQADDQETSGEVCTSQDYLISSALFPSDSSDSSISISSAAEDHQFFADDEYDDGTYLKVSVPGTSHSVSQPRGGLPSSDSGLSFITSTEPCNIHIKSLQTSDSSEKRGLSSIGEAEPGVESQDVPTDSTALLQLAEQLSDDEVELTPRLEHQHPLQVSTASLEVINCETPRQSIIGTETLLSDQDVASTERHITNPLGKQETCNVADGRQFDQLFDFIACDTCQSVDKLFTRTRMFPCEHLACFSCLTASINIVGADGAKARCTYCQKTVSDLSPGERISSVTASEARKSISILGRLEPVPITSTAATARDLDSNATKATIIMRIDNIAWNATPEILKDFLPQNVLADTLQPVHLLIDRKDGKCKDFMYIEVKNIAAAQLILKDRQNAVLGTGSRARPVTITLTTEEALVEELRPNSRAELMGLVDLCNAAIQNNIGHDDYNLKERRNIDRDLLASSFGSTSASRRVGEGTPLQTGIFLKSRYAPFWSALSIVSRLKPGHEVFWDMLEVIAGVISILGKHLSVCSSTNKVLSATANHFNEADTDMGQTLPATSMQKYFSNESALSLSSPAASVGGNKIDPKVAQLNDRIRKKLAEETALTKSEKPTARNKFLENKSRSIHAPFRGARDSRQQWEREVPRRIRLERESHSIKQKDWTRSDMIMLEKMIKVFEEKFLAQITQLVNLAETRSTKTA